MYLPFSIVPKCESTTRRFQPGEGPGRGLLCDCETSNLLRVSSSSSLLKSQAVCVAVSAVVMVTISKVQFKVNIYLCRRLQLSVHCGFHSSYVMLHSMLFPALPCLCYSIISILCGNVYNQDYISFEFIQWKILIFTEVIVELKWKSNLIWDLRGLQKMHSKTIIRYFSRYENKIRIYHFQ